MSPRVNLTVTVTTRNAPIQEKSICFCRYVTQAGLELMFILPQSSKLLGLQVNATTVRKKLLFLEDLSSVLVENKTRDGTWIWKGQTGHLHKPDDAIC